MKPTKSGSVSASQTSGNSAAQSSVSNKRWQRPRNVRQFVTQVNEVATALLNGELSNEEIERIRIYSALTRVIAQGMTTEVQRGRFLKQAPDLEFDE